MHESTNQPFEMYIAQIMDGLKDLSPAHRDAVARELWGHLEDVAADCCQSPKDPLLQQQVMADLGRTDDMIAGFRHAYSSPRSLMRSMGDVLSLIGSAILTVVPAEFLVNTMPLMYSHSTATKVWWGRACERLEGCIWSLEPQMPDFIGPWLLIGILLLFCIIGCLLGIGTILQRHGRDTGRMLVKTVVIGLPVVLVLALLFANYGKRGGLFLLHVWILGALPAMIGVALIWRAQRIPNVSEVG